MGWLAQSWKVRTLVCFPFKRSVWIGLYRIFALLACCSTSLARTSPPAPPAAFCRRATPAPRKRSSPPAAGASNSVDAGGDACGERTFNCTARLCPPPSRSSSLESSLTEFNPLPPPPWRGNDFRAGLLLAPSLPICARKAEYAEADESCGFSLRSLFSVAPLVSRPSSPLHTVFALMRAKTVGSPSSWVQPGENERTFVINAAEHEPRADDHGAVCGGGGFVCVLQDGT
jgi:hypothetical protein